MRFKNSNQFFFEFIKSFFDFIMNAGKILSGVFAVVMGNTYHYNIHLLRTGVGRNEENKEKEILHILPLFFNIKVCQFPRITTNGDSLPVKQ